MTAYLYHVTYLRNLEQVRGEGLVPGRGTTFAGGYRTHSVGRVFLTDGEAVPFWHERYAAAALHHSDDLAHDGYVPAVLRVDAENLDLHADGPGTSDSRAPSWFTEQPVPADRIEVFDGVDWHPVSDVEPDELQEGVYATADVDHDDVDEWGNPAYVPDMDVYLPPAGLGPAWHRMSRDDYLAHPERPRGGDHRAHVEAALSRGAPAWTHDYPDLAPERGPRVLYHASPSDNRASITETGLVCSPPAHNFACGDSVYLADTADDAVRWAAEIARERGTADKFDVWEVDPSAAVATMVGTTNTEIGVRQWKCRADVPAEALRLHITLHVEPANNPTRPAGAEL